jgi:hypothetical protein
MTKALGRRLDRLAERFAPPSDKIIVWCWFEEDVPFVINALIAEGDITEADRSRCIHCFTAKKEDFPIELRRHEDRVASGFYESYAARFFSADCPGPASQKFREKNEAALRDIDRILRHNAAPVVKTAD